MNFKVPRGTQDILPSETWKWQKVEKLISEVCELYRYKEIRTPMFEQTELFQRLWEKRRMLFKKKCIHLLTGEIVR